MTPEPQSNDAPTPKIYDVHGDLMGADEAIATLARELADMTKQRDEANQLLQAVNLDSHVLQQQRDTALAQANALRTQLAEAQASQAFIENERFCQMRDQRDALRTRCASLEAALKPLARNFGHWCAGADMGETVKFQVPTWQEAMDAHTLLDAALRNPSPAPRAVVTSPDEPPAQARERIRQ